VKIQQEPDYHLKYQNLQKCRNIENRKWNKNETISITKHRRLSRWT